MIPKETLGSDYPNFNKIAMIPDCTQDGWSGDMSISAPITIFTSDLTFGPFCELWRGYDAPINGYGEYYMIPKESNVEISLAVLPDWADLYWTKNDKEHDLPIVPFNSTVSDAGAFSYALKGNPVDTAYFGGLYDS